MRIKSGPIIAVVLAALLFAWIGLGGSNQGEAVTETAEAPQQPVSLPTVQAEVVEAEPIDRTLVLNGHTEAKRSVMIRSEAAGRVIKLNKNKGDFVEKGELIIQVDTSDLKAQLASARALEKQRKLELDGSKRLFDQGLQNSAQLAASTALHEQAKAQRYGLELALADTEVRAPFEGFLNARPVELGSFVQPGDMVAEILNFNPLLFTVQVSENNVQSIDIGMTAIAELANGSEIPAQVSFISASANPTTRTFTVDLESLVELENPVAGTTVSVEIPVETTMAHFISPALLILDDDGRLGIKVLDDENRVHFKNVEIAESTPRGIWVTGLPVQTNVITVGQGFVDENDIVEAMFNEIDDAAANQNPVIAEASEG